MSRRVYTSAVTFNQRVPGSSPGALTRKFRDSDRLTGFSAPVDLAVLDLAVGYFRGSAVAVDRETGSPASDPLDTTMTPNVGKLIGGGSWA